MRYFIKKIQLIAAFFFLGLLTIHANDFDESLLIYNNDLQAINAVLLHPNGEAHFFINKYFFKYNVQYDKIKQKGVIGKHGWYKLPQNVDAALMHPNKKGYIFSGNSYYRYDFSKKKVDKQGVLGVDGWKGVEGPIDAAIVHPTNNCAYFFKGKKYYRFSFSKEKVDKVGTIGVDGWKGLPANIDAAIIHPNGRAYFFDGDYYYRHVFGKGIDKKGVIGRDGWKGLFNKVDAVVTNAKEERDFFRKKNVLSHTSQFYVDNDKYAVNAFDIKIRLPLLPPLEIRKYVKKLKLGYEAYKGTPTNIDAAVLNSKNKKYYFFKGSKYYRYNPSLEKIDKVGIIGKDGWKGVPKNIDAAATSNNKTYFFKNINYYEYDHNKGKVIKSGSIKSRFKKVPDYIDAAVFEKNSNDIINLYKKDVIYKYSFKKNRTSTQERLYRGLFE